MTGPPAVLVTGGGKRIGAAIARAFAAIGWRVIIHYWHSRAPAEELAASLALAETIRFDLMDWDLGAAELAALASRLDDWRVLVNCASVFEFDSADALDPGIFARAVRINAGSPARLAQTFLQCAKSLRGRCVIQVTDQKLRNPNPDFFSYTMSKHALAATVPMLAMACTDPLDRVYGLAPGAILASHDQTEAETELSHRMNLLRRRTQLDDVAQAALFLAEGWLASGETLFVDAGQHLLAQPRDVLFLARG